LTIAAAQPQPASLNDHPEPSSAPVPGSAPLQQMPARLATAPTTTREPLEHEPTPLKQVVTLPQSRPSTAEIEGLLKRGDYFISAGDITSARLFHESAAEAGDGRAALRMGITFDPVFIGQAGIVTAIGNQQEAYRRARDLGQTAAESRLKDFD